MRPTAALLVLLAAACGQADPTSRTGLQPAEVLSGYSFLQPETQALQDDDFSNPGFLWIDRGEALFHAAVDGAQACASCHAPAEEAMRGVAARYPAIDEKSGTLVNLEGRINLCRKRHQSLVPLDHESDALLGLTAYVAYQSKGLPVSVEVSDRTEPYLEAGQDYFFTQRGQLDLSCHQCHDQNWGKQLRGDTISQGHGNAFPAYRLEWQALGSLQRRLRDCDTGVRAEPLPYGSETYIAVELYLAQRAAGLEIETPGVRR